MSNPRQNPRLWCDDLQTRLMKALDDAWALAERTDDPAVRAKALAKAKLCGQFAASARKIAALCPESPRAAIPSNDTRAYVPAVEATDEGPKSQVEIAKTALQRLKAGGGRRGRL